MKGPLQELPRIAYRPLAVIGVLSALNAILLVVQAFLLAEVLAGIVHGSSDVNPWPLLAAVVGRAVVAWTTKVTAQRAAVNTKEKLRRRAIEGALAKGPEWIDAKGPGELTAITTRGLDALESYFTEYLPALVTAAVVPLLAGVAVLFADWPSALVIAVTVPLMPMFAVLVGLHTGDRVKDSTDAMERAGGQLLELVRALPVLRAFGRAEAQAEVVRGVSERHRVSTVATMRLAFSSAFVLELLATLSVALVAVVIGVRLVSGDLTLAVALGVLILAPECYQPIRTVGAAFHSSADGVEALRRLRPLVDGTGRRGGSARPATPQVSVSGLSVLRRGRLAPEEESFVVTPGEIVRLDSASGAGKSTTLGVLLGFVAASSGSVQVGDVPLDDVDQVWWRRQVAWVPQHPVLTEQTVADELWAATADMARTPTAGEMAAVASEVGVGDLLQRDPRRLSIGQRQRVAVARALLRVRAGAWLLLLDEPTAHLDDANSARVDAAIRRAADAGAGAVWAAHDPSNPPGPEPGFDAVPAGRHVDIATDAARDRDVLALRELVGSRLLGGALLGALALVSGVALAATSAWLIAKASTQPPILTLTVAIVGVRTFGIGRAVLRYVERLMTHDAALRTATTLRVGLWRRLVRTPSALSASAEQLRLVHDVDVVRDQLPRVLTPPLVAGVVAAVAVAVQAWVLPSAGWVLAAAVVLGVGGSVVAVLGAERRASAQVADGQRDVRARVQALLDAAADLVAFGRARTHRMALTAADAQVARLGRRSALGAGVAEAVIVLVSGGAAVVCTVLAARAVATGALDPLLAPVLALVPLAVAEVLMLVPDAARRAETLTVARRHLGRLGPAANAPARTNGAVWPVEGAPASTTNLEDGSTCSGTVHPSSSNRLVRLDHVSLRWPGASDPVLREVNLHIEPGTNVAVTGASGAGKSTLLAALLGFLPPEEGAVEVPRDVVWAPQDPRLISTTLAENLRLADPHATDDQLRDVLRAACLPDFTGHLDLELGNAGAGLSGGQARRLSLARALLAVRNTDHALVLLDEPTAHLDTETATELRASLSAELDGHTVFHVTHRSEEAAGADVVLDIRDGRLTELVSAL